MNTFQLIYSIIGIVLFPIFYCYSACKKVRECRENHKEFNYYYSKSDEDTAYFEAFLTAIFLAAIFPITILIFICNRIVGKILKKL